MTCEEKLKKISALVHKEADSVPLYNSAYYLALDILDVLGEEGKEG